MTSPSLSSGFTTTVWRPLSYFLVHRNIFSLLFGLSPFVYTGGRIERAIGSLRFAFMVLIFSQMLALSFITIEFARAFMLHLNGRDFWELCIEGLTGVTLSIQVVYVYNFVTKPTISLPMVSILSQSVFFPLCLRLSFSSLLAAVLVYTPNSRP